MCASRSGHIFSDGRDALIRTMYSPPSDPENSLQDQLIPGTNSRSFPGAWLLGDVKSRITIAKCVNIQYLHPGSFVTPTICPEPDNFIKFEVFENNRQFYAHLLGDRSTIIVNGQLHRGKDLMIHCPHGSRLIVNGCAAIILYNDLGNTNLRYTCSGTLKRGDIPGDLLVGPPNILEHIPVPKLDSMNYAEDTTLSGLVSSLLAGLSQQTQHLPSDEFFEQFVEKDNSATVQATCVIYDSPFYKEPYANWAARTLNASVASFFDRNAVDPVIENGFHDGDDTAPDLPPLTVAGDCCSGGDGSIDAFGPHGTSLTDSTAEMAPVDTSVGSVSSQLSHLNAEPFESSMPDTGRSLDILEQHQQQQVAYTERSKDSIEHKIVSTLKQMITEYKESAFPDASRNEEFRLSPALSPLPRKRSVYQKQTDQILQRYPATLYNAAVVNRTPTRWDTLFDYVASTRDYFAFPYCSCFDKTAAEPGDRVFFGLKLGCRHKEAGGVTRSDNDFATNTPYLAWVCDSFEMIPFVHDIVLDNSLGLIFVKGGYLYAHSTNPERELRVGLKFVPSGKALRLDTKDVVEVYVGDMLYKVMAYLPPKLTKKDAPSLIIPVQRLRLPGLCYDEAKEDKDLPSIIDGCVIPAPMLFNNSVEATKLIARYHHPGNVRATMAYDGFTDRSSEAYLRSVDKNQTLQKRLVRLLRDAGRDSLEDFYFGMPVSFEPVSEDDINYKYDKLFNGALQRFSSKMPKTTGSASIRPPKMPEQARTMLYGLGLYTEDQQDALWSSLFQSWAYKDVHRLPLIMSLQMTMTDEQVGYLKGFGLSGWFAKWEEAVRTGGKQIWASLQNPILKGETTVWSCILQCYAIYWVVKRAISPSSQVPGQNHAKRIQRARDFGAMLAQILIPYMCIDEVTDPYESGWISAHPDCKKKLVILRNTFVKEGRAQLAFVSAIRQDWREFFDHTKIATAMCMEFLSSLSFGGDDDYNLVSLDSDGNAITMGRPQVEALCSRIRQTFAGESPAPKRQRSEQSLNDDQVPSPKRQKRD